jgi:hypothetical protein
MPLVNLLLVSTLIEVFDSFSRDLLDRTLTGHDIFHCCQYRRPVLEDCEWNVLSDAVSNKIYNMSDIALCIRVRFLTMSLFCEQQICFFRRTEI